MSYELVAIIVVCGVFALLLYWIFSDEAER
jgi:hypothetical protein